MTQTVRRYQDLAVWQIADELRLEVYRLVAAGPAFDDWRFRDQIRNAAGSVAANIVEGYRRFSPKDFARFLQIAYASAGETQHWLEDGCARGHWTESEIDAARRLLRRLDPPLLALMRYLRTPAAQDRSKR